MILLYLTSNINMKVLTCYVGVWYVDERMFKYSKWSDRAEFMNERWIVHKIEDTPIFVFILL
jgi:hypothetical protein